MHFRDSVFSSTFELTANDTAGPAVTSVTSGLGQFVTALAEVILSSVDDNSTANGNQELLQRMKRGRLKGKRFTR